MNCPVCRATNDQGPHCRRCKADLSLLFDLERQRSRGLARAQELTMQGYWWQALAVVEGINALRPDTDSQRLQAVLHLLKRNFAAAWQCYLAATSDRACTEEDVRLG